MFFTKTLRNFTLQNNRKYLNKHSVQKGESNEILTSKIHLSSEKLPTKSGGVGKVKTFPQKSYVSYIL